MENEEQPNYEPLDPSVLDNIDQRLTELDELDQAVTPNQPSQPQQETPAQPTQQQTEPSQPTESATPEQGDNYQNFSEIVGGQELEQDDQFIPQLMEGKADLGDYARFGMEMGGAPVAGVVDFGIDAVNLIPGVDIPKIPKYQNDLATSLRQLTSLIAPNVFIGGRIVKGIQGATKVYPWAQTALAKWLGGAAVSAGVGAAVDYTVDFNKTDDNALGSIKKMFPESMQWVSDDWATLDSDSPDLKREKNVREGAALGIFTDLLGGFAQLARGIKGTKAGIKIIPEDELATTYQKGVKKAEEATPEDVLENGAKSREDALDEVAFHELSEAEQAALDQPIVGITDSFDAIEEGVRTVDPQGVVGASVDAVRIATNNQTVLGRLGSIISEGALKFGLKAGELPKRTIVNLIKENIRNAGKYSAEIAGGAKITFDMIDEQGTRLAEVLFDPRMDTGFLKATLNEYKDLLNKMDGMKPSLGDVGYNATMKAIRSYLDEYVNMDVQKASAYLTHSLGGQVSDMAEGMRYVEGTEAVQRAQAMILDRLEYLMVEKGFAAYNRGSSLNFLNTWKRLDKNPDAVREAAMAAKEGNEDYLKNIASSANTTINTLRNASRNNPHQLTPLIMAWEFSDGDINTIGKLNNFVDQSLPNIQKAIYDEQPEIPNQIVQGAWANIYNSVLSAISTPIKATLGNTGGLLAKPASVMVGGLIARDWETVQRGWYQYSAFGDTFQKAFVHMKNVFHKASVDPSSVGYIMRDDIALKNEQTMDILHSYATAAEKDGNLGPMALYNMAEALHDISNNPVLRFGTNAMTAMDGFTRAFVAVGEARGQAWDKYIRGKGELSGKTLKQAEDEIYEQMFDKSGMITNKAVDYASREIALNLDNEAVSAIGKFISHHAYLKPFLMFPRTSANMISVTNKYAPWSVFMNDYNKLAYGRLDSFTIDEVRNILQSKGIEWTGNPELDMQAFSNLRAEVRGRKAIGTATIMGAGLMFTQDRLRGNGHYDKERQRVRQDLNWKKRTFKAWDGNWYSYDGMGPISDFLALVADVMDHQDSMEENDVQTTFAKLGFLLSANLTSKSTLAGLEPMYDVLSGNPAAANRWAASWANSLGPMAGFRNELGRLMSPQLREVDQEFFQLLRNRNKFLDVFDPNVGLPSKYDWIDGKPIGYTENWFARGWNAIMPMKVSGELSPEKQFLIDVEFDSRPAFNKSSKGVDYTPEERSEMYNLMGKQGFFKKEIQRIMKTTTAQEWRKRMIEARMKGGKIEPQYWESLYRELEMAMRNAKALAEQQMSNADEIKRRTYESSYNRRAQEMGRPNEFPLVNR